MLHAYLRTPQNSILKGAASRGSFSHFETAPFGRYQNVHLTQTEYLELQAELSSLDSLIEQLSSYMQSESRTYADHAATLRRWAKNGYGQKPSPKTIPDYTCKEDESL